MVRAVVPENRIKKLAGCLLFFTAAAAAAACLVLSGCASIRPVGSDEFGGQPRVSGVKNDLSGMEEKALRTLSSQYISGGKVFLYAEQDTYSPIVPKGEALFALQFKTALLAGGDSEALIFNKYMLEYMHDALKRRQCPEHRGIALLPVPVKYGLPSEREMKLERRGKLVIGPRKTPAGAPKQGFVCPVDGRKFIPYISSIPSISSFQKDIRQ